MTTITLDIPDELAVRLNPLREQLPIFLELVVDWLPGKKTRSNGESQPVNSASPVYLEVLDFLATGPTLEQIAEFKVSQQMQDRVEELLGKNREEGLTDQESSEMGTYLRVSHIMILLKARARKALSNALL